MSSRWKLAHAQRLASHPSPQTRIFSEGEVERSIAELYLWDPWPVLNPAGEIARVGGAQLWMALSAPSNIEPNERHDVARIRLLTYTESCKQPQWQDHGNALPENGSPGSREWAGCATYFADSRELELCYTASGVRGEKSPSFIQRIFVSTATLLLQGEELSLTNWTDHKELVQPGALYQSTLDQLTGTAGYIKAFRDPFRFVDPADGRLYVLFTASMVGSTTPFDGAIGAASGPNLEELTLLPSLLTADGVNNELERPHVVVQDGLYYLFFSTQARTFHPDLAGPTGLYGFVANRMDGAWQPLNDSGLILSNPAAEPFQAYSWYVTQDLRVHSFVDFLNLKGAQLEEVEADVTGRQYFAGSISPSLKISLQADRAQLTKDS